MVTAPGTRGTLLVVVAHPDDEAALALTAIAERIETELAPRKVFRPELRIT